jgi:hypothetical protein
MIMSQFLNRVIEVSDYVFIRTHKLSICVKIKDHYFSGLGVALVLETEFTHHFLETTAF